MGHGEQFTLSREEILIISQQSATYGTERKLLGHESREGQYPFPLLAFKFTN